jgi:hypothetical protein
LGCRQSTLTLAKVSLKEAIMGAPLNPVPQVLRTFIHGETDDTSSFHWGNVLHFKYTGAAPSNADCATLATDISEEWGTHMSPECPSPTKLLDVTVTDLTSDSAGEGEWLGTVLGSRGDDSIPSNAALLITYPAGTRYKGGHPRSYLYVLGNADLDGSGRWSFGGTAEVQAHWQAFLTACVGLAAGATTISSFGFVRYRGKFLPNGGPPHYYLDSPIYTPIVIAEAIAEQEIASQKRRVGRRKA